MEAQQYIQQNQGKYITSIMINESEIYSLMKDGSWERHEWKYDVEFLPEKIPGSMIFNSINDVISYLKQQNNFPDIKTDEDDTESYYQFFADQIPTQDQMIKCIKNDSYTFEDICEVMMGAYDLITGQLAVEITDQVLN
jgi:hypothetical protein